MSKIVSVLFLFSNIFSFAQNVDINLLQKEYQKVNTDSVACAKLFEKVKNDNSNNPTIICYKGAITAAMANHTKNKQEKLKLFKDGKKLIEQAVASDSNNVEIRFLRFTIQTNCPKIMGYNKQIEADKKYIVANFNSIKNASFKKSIGNFLVNSKCLSEDEKQKIK